MTRASSLLYIAVNLHAPPSKRRAGAIRTRALLSRPRVSSREGVVRSLAYWLALVYAALAAVRLGSRFGRYDDLSGPFAVCHVSAAVRSNVATARRRRQQQQHAGPVKLIIATQPQTKAATAKATMPPQDRKTDLDMHNEARCERNHMKRRRRRRRRQQRRRHAHIPMKNAHSRRR